MAFRYVASYSSVGSIPHLPVRRQRLHAGNEESDDESSVASVSGNPRESLASADGGHLEAQFRRSRQAYASVLPPRYNMDASEVPRFASAVTPNAVFVDTGAHTHDLHRDAQLMPSRLIHRYH